MDKKEWIAKAYDRSELLRLENPTYRERVRDFTEKWFQEDVGAGDVTTDALLLKDNRAKAVIKAKSSGVIAGIAEAEWFYHNHNINVEGIKTDGSAVKKGDIILALEGMGRDLLETERTGLNLLQRMSSIATLTRQMVERIGGRPVEIVPPRKNHWGMLDKKAVFLGGGLTHRLGLWESILIKENHLEAIKSEGHDDCIEIALERAFKFEKTVFVEIEVEDIEDCLKAAKKFREYKNGKPCIIMLDNFTVEDAGKAVAVLTQKNLREHVIIESSGRITPDNIVRYADTGVDIISMSYITYAQNICDLSQRMV
ncbi:MAG: carboxylating nicotinate-nucleotide diphosphorylase [Thermodesulfobacteriota bacterium]